MCKSECKDSWGNSEVVLMFECLNYSHVKDAKVNCEDVIFQNSAIRAMPSF